MAGGNTSEDAARGDRPGAHRLGSRRRIRQVLLVAGGVGARGRAGASGGRQLRQRLQRRRARLRRAAGRTRPARRGQSGAVRGSAERRVGPVRLVVGGLAPPRQVKPAAFCFFCVAGVAGLALAAVTSWWLLAVGAACIAAAWFYTGGPKPYGYNGLGEVFVFACFGVVAVAGTAYVQMNEFICLGLAASVPAALLACSLVMVNNLRIATSSKSRCRGT